MEKAQTIAGSGTRSRHIASNNSSVKAGSVEVKLEPKATPEEIKDKLEQQLKLQRAALQQKRNDKTPLTTPASSQQVTKVTSNSTSKG